MFVSHRDEIEKKRIEGAAVKGVTKQILVGREQGWDDYVMRMFTLDAEGYAPRHAHDWPHIMYAVEGHGNLFMDGKNYPLTAGSVAYVPENIDHQVSNAGTDSEKFVFICIVPKRGES